MFRTTLAVAVTTASLALATNVHAFLGQVPLNGRSLNGCQDESICGTDYKLPNHQTRADRMGKIPAWVDSAGGQRSGHPGALFDGTNGTSLSGISADIAAEGMKLESGDNSSIAQPALVGVMDKVAYISLNGPSLNGLSFTRQLLVRRIHQHGCQRVRSNTCE